MAVSAAPWQATVQEILNEISRLEKARLALIGSQLLISRSPIPSPMFFFQFPCSFSSSRPPCPVPFFRCAFSMASAALSY